MQRMEENNKVKPIVDMAVPGKRPRARQTKGKMNGLHPKGHAGAADYPGGCPGQNILEVKNSGR